ncbi:MAG: O-antigen ligase family protein [Actinomycetota bacterium]|nr:O-antigen ligase family protein [Actinomycetota bacterium]MDQ2958811.1 O-antigen ligase family protein [Actinomycetota bacterium]
MAEQSTTAPLELDRRTGFDAVTLLTFFFFVLFAIPSRLIFAPLGASGTPAQVLSLGLGTWWAAVKLAGAAPDPRSKDVIRRAMLLFVGAILISYLVAATRPVSAAELRQADTGLVLALGWLGLLLFTGSGLASMTALQTTLRRLVLAGGLLAALGLVQFVTKRPFTNYIQIPGLTTNNTLVSVVGRGGLTRPAGTALHPIEFGAVLTMILPIALHFAMHDRTRNVTRRWFPVALIAIAVPISISRSAIVSTIVVLLLVLPTWSRATRRATYAVMVALFGLLYVAVPGLLGTLSGLFTGISGDSSAQSRTDSYALATEFITRHPIFGRGFLTFLPQYRILDNQYLGLAIETGVVGVATLLILFLCGIFTGYSIRRRGVDAATASLANALAASVASAGASFALFDAFSFPMAATLVFFMLGCLAALDRLNWYRAADRSIGSAA